MNLDDVVPTTNFKKRKRSLFSLQTFKNMKRVGDLVACIPHLDDCEVNVAGDGIERCYMTSKDKCKKKYICSLERDPDASDEMIGNKIWDNATEAGMNYLGFISGVKRDQILGDTKFFIDSTWSKTYGEHFNRTFIEAMIQGVVPIAVNLGISSNESGVGSLFTPNENYLMLKYDYTPKQYADKINEYLDIDEEEYQRIANNNFNLLKKFDRKKIAQDFINLSEGIECGEEYDTPTYVEPRLVEKSSVMFSKWFGV